jgi:ubiquinone/menaquinone biosynthesis C-methylase UbiE
MYFRHVVERAVASMLNEAGVSLAGDVLDVGCGGGTYTRFIVDLGADPARTTGIDLVPTRIDAARRDSPPSMRWQVADATALPFEDASFDVVTQFTALCNLRDVEMRRRAADEIARVLRPGGLVLWFDVSQTTLPELHGITGAELRALFPGLEIFAERPVLVRGSWLIAGRAPAICSVLEAGASFLPCTNLAALLRRATPVAAGSR